MAKRAPDQFDDISGVTEALSNAEVDPNKINAAAWAGYQKLLAKPVLSKEDMKRMALFNKIIASYAALTAKTPSLLGKDAKALPSVKLIGKSRNQVKNSSIKDPSGDYLRSVRPADEDE